MCWFGLWKERRMPEMLSYVKSRHTLEAGETEAESDPDSLQRC